MYKIVIFDLDGTLIESVSSWKTLHEYFNAREKEVKQNAEDYFSNKYDYLEWMHRDIALWLDKRPHISDIKKAFGSFNVDITTKNAIKELRSNGMKVYIVSAGIDVLAERVGEELGVDGVYANKLNADELGYLDGSGTCIVDPLKKHELVLRIAKEEGISTQEIICVGDTKYDISMFEGVGLKIALNSKHDELCRSADACFDNIKDVVKYILNYN